MLPTFKSEAERLLLKVKVACCKECGGWLTQAAFPYCESQKYSVREFAKHAKAGDSIDVMTVGEGMKLHYCVCDLLKEAQKRANQATGSLFSQLA